MVNDVIHQHRSQQIPFGCGDEYAISTAKRPRLVQNTILCVCERCTKSISALIEQSNQLLWRVEVRQWPAFHEIEAVGFENRGSALRNIRDVRGELANRPGFLVRLPIALSRRKALEYSTCRRELAIQIDEKK